MKKIKFNYIDILNEHLELRSARNVNYSLRAFARDLELDPSRLSQILNKKKGLSAKAAEGIALKLGLNESEREFFILSAKSQHSRSLSDKKEATQSLTLKLAPESQLKKIEMHDFEQAHNWYYLAILELIELDECEHSIEWFSKKLKLKKTVVKSALERMEKLSWLTFKKGKYLPIFEKKETSYDIPSTAIKKYHEEMLKKAEQSLYTDDVHDREFLNMTLAFSKIQMKEAKEAIRLFQKDFAKKFYPEQTKDKDSVYQLSVQLFRLDSILEKGEIK